MIRLQVTCQDALGNRVQVDVRAQTDEQASAAVLRELNSWRVLCVLPAVGHPASVAPRVLKEPEVSSPAVLMPAAAISGEPPVGAAPGSLSTPTFTHTDEVTLPDGPRGPKVIRTTTVVEWIGDSSHGRLGTMGRALAKAAARSGDRRC